MTRQVASAFGLTREDLGADGWQQLSAAIPQMLQQPSSYKAAVYLFMQFEVRIAYDAPIVNAAPARQTHAHSARGKHGITISLNLHAHAAYTLWQVSKNTWCLAGSSVCHAAADDSVSCLGPCVCHVQGLDEIVDRVEVLTQLVADGQDNLAQHWATRLGKDYQVLCKTHPPTYPPPVGQSCGHWACVIPLAKHASVTALCQLQLCSSISPHHHVQEPTATSVMPRLSVACAAALQVSFVEVCVALDRLKPAARAVRQLQLAAEFPNVEALYRQRSLARLMNKHLWPVALSYAGSDASLQVRDVAAGMLTVLNTAAQPQTAPLD